MGTASLWVHVWMMVLRIPVLLEADVICNNPLGLDMNLPPEKRLREEQFTASSEQPYRTAPSGRLNFPRSFAPGNRNFGMWCAERKDKEPWFQVDFTRLTAVSTVTIATEEFSSYTTWVRTYAMKYSYNGTLWFSVKDDNGNEKIFQGITSRYERYTAQLGTMVVARYIRIYPKSFENEVCLKADMNGCLPGRDCRQALGVYDRAKVPDRAMTASSVESSANGAFEARLNNTVAFAQSGSIRRIKSWGCWCPAPTDATPWLQIDFGRMQKVSGIATQGAPSTNRNVWVIEYKLNFSLTGKSWREYQIDERTKIFLANSNQNSVRAQFLESSIDARYMRIVPTKWNMAPCMRVEIYHCVPIPGTVPRIVSGLSDGTFRRGAPVTLTCEFSGQPGIDTAWYRDGEFLGTDDRVSVTESHAGATARTVLEFKWIKMKEDGASFTCVAWYPSSETRAESTASLSVLGPFPAVSVAGTYATSADLTLSSSGELTDDVLSYRLHVYLDGKYEMTRTVPFSNATVTFKVGPLRPYSSYSVKVALAFASNDVEPFQADVAFRTEQDVPYGSPLNLEVAKTSHKSFFCSWDPPKPSLSNGPITGYEVRYTKSVTQKDSPVTETQFTSETMVNLGGLAAGSLYEVSVRAYTVVGPGPYSWPPVLAYTGAATQELASINKIVITDNNAVAVGTRLKNITSNPVFLNKNDIAITADILEKMVDAQNKSREIAETLVVSLSNILSANETVLVEGQMANQTGLRYIRLLDKWLQSVETDADGLEEEAKNIAVRKVLVKKLDLEEGLKFEKEQGSITIPKEMFGQGTKNESEETIYFVYYKTNTFFAKKSKVEESCVDGFTVLHEKVFTPVLSSEVVGADVSNLSAPVVLKFPSDGRGKMEATACVYWDFGADGGKGAWSSEGCQLHSIENQTIICHCTHLTNFAAMMDVFASTSRACGFHGNVLTYISRIGCFLSLIGLFITIITYTMFRRLRRELAAQVLIQLCLSLFVILVTFLIGIDQTQRRSACAAVAVILHYFTLVAFMWMLMEAIFMYRAFVRVWPPQENDDIRKCTFAAWGIPFLVVATTIAFKFESYGGANYCLLVGVPLYISYLGPICLIMVTNAVVFALVMYRLSSRPSSGVERNVAAATASRLKRAFGIMLLMGLTWAFGFMTAASGVRLVFSYLFAVCNSLQGFAIFVFYCLAQRHARLAWRGFLKCEPRGELRRSTDSCNERRRLSSGASNLTNTWQVVRGNSSASSVFRSASTSTVKQRHASSNGSIMSGGAVDRIRMQPIEEVDLADHSTVASDSSRHPFLLTDVDLHEVNFVPERPFGSHEIAENNRSRLPPHECPPVPDVKYIVPLEEYSSYRVLSGAQSNTALDLVRTGSQHNLSRSMKDLNRRSMCDLQVLPLAQPPRGKIGATKSCEQISKRRPGPTNPELQAGVESSAVVLRARKVNKSSRDRLHSVAQTNDELGAGIPSMQSKESKACHRIDSVRTTKSDASTMTDLEDPNAAVPALQAYGRPMDGRFGPPLRGFQGPGCTVRSQEDIIQWLHSCDDGGLRREDLSDSDYSSSAYYKTSPSSSVAEVPKSVAPGVIPGTINEQGCETSGKLVVSPRQSPSNRMQRPAGSGLTPAPPNVPVRTSLTGLLSSATQQTSDALESSDDEFVSEAGYNASEEEIGESRERKKLGRRKHRQRTSAAVTSRDYRRLDDPEVTLV